MPFVGIFFPVKAFESLQQKAQEQGVKLTGNKALMIIFGVILPILPINLVSLAILQHNVNKLYKAEEKEHA